MKKVDYYNFFSHPNIKKVRTFYQKSKKRLLEKAKQFCNNNKQRLQEQARNKYRESSN